MSGFAVDTGMLNQLSRQFSQIAADLMATSIAHEVSAAQIGGPQLAEALNEFHGYWNKRSNAMETSLRSLAQLVCKD